MKRPLTPSGMSHFPDLPAEVILLIIATVLSVQTALAGDKTWGLATRIYGDNKARHIGDILTVIIEEDNLATTDAKSSSSKNSSLGGSLSFAHPTVDARGTAWTNAALPAYSLDTSREFDGSGSIQNSEKMNTRITVQVTDILPNGNLLIEGKRSVHIQGEDAYFVLTGTVRPTDITRQNTVSSTLIADAAISYNSKGPIAKNQKRGMLTALWNWINPF